MKMHAYYHLVACKHTPFWFGAMLSELIDQLKEEKFHRQPAKLALFVAE